MTMTITYDKPTIDKMLKVRYGFTGKELQQLDEDGKFNIWDAYTFLKKACHVEGCGSKDNPGEYDRRIKIIQELLNM